MADAAGLAIGFTNLLVELSKYKKKGIPKPLNNLIEEMSNLVSEALKTRRDIQISERYVWVHSKERCQLKDIGGHRVAVYSEFLDREFRKDFELQKEHLERLIDSWKKMFR